MSWTGSRDDSENICLIKHALGAVNKTSCFPYFLGDFFNRRKLDRKLDLSYAKKRALFKARGAP